MTTNTGGAADGGNNGRSGTRPDHGDSDGIPDQVTVEDTVVTPLDTRDPYRLIWLVSQIVLYVSVVAAVLSMGYGLATDTENAWIGGLALLGIAMLAMIAALVARLGSDLKNARVI